MGALLARHRERLRRMVALRLDQRLHGRIDASDVIQEAYLEAWHRLPEYLRQPTMPFFLWLRFLTGQKVLALHRHHLRREMRDAGREVSLYRGALPEASSAALAAQLMGHDTRPSEAALRVELKLLSGRPECFRVQRRRRYLARTKRLYPPRIRTVRSW